MIEPSKVSSVVARLKRFNQEYTTAEISTMAQTAIFEKSITSPTELYFAVLSRILEEKGYIYHDKQFIKPVINCSDSLDSYGYYEGIRKGVSNLIQVLLRTAKLSDEELFVLGCVYKIEPMFKTKAIATVFNSLPPHVDSHKMTYKTIGEYLQKGPKEVAALHHGAIAKLEKICANNRILGAGCGDTGLGRASDGC